MSAKPRHGHCFNKKGFTKTYVSWSRMKDRCLNPNSHKYPSYGERGITVCDRWLKFDNFLADMGERPEGKTLDRYPDNQGNYEPSNCRWATDSLQQLNKRTCNPTGFKGVFRTKNGEKFLSVIQHKKKSYYIGTFDTAKLASLAYEACREVVYGR